MEENIITLIDEDGKVKGINLGNDEIIDCDLLVV